MHNFGKTWPRWLRPIECLRCNLQLKGGSKWKITQIVLAHVFWDIHLSKIQRRKVAHILLFGEILRKPVLESCAMQSSDSPLSQGCQNLNTQWHWLQGTKTHPTSQHLSLKLSVLCRSNCSTCGRDSLKLNTILASVMNKLMFHLHNADQCELWWVWWWAVEAKISVAWLLHPQLTHKCTLQC